MPDELTVLRLTPSSPDPDLARYDRFVEDSPQGIMYDRTWWLEALAPGQWQVVTLCKGDAIKAAWPWVLRKQRGRWRIGMPTLTQKLGILFAPSTAKYVERLSTEHRLTSRLVEELPPGAVLNQCFHENFTSWLPFYWEGLRQTTRYTYILKDLSDVDRLWRDMRDARRRAIRKALKQELRVREIEDPEEFCRLSGKTFERQGKSFPYDVNLVARFDRAAAEYAGRRMTVAEDNAQRIHACDYLVFDRRCAVSLMGGADEALRSSGGQVLLEWESILFAAQHAKVFDFEGSMIPGIEHFMRGFGAVQTPFFRISGMAESTRRHDILSSLRRTTARRLRRLANALDPA